MLTFDSYEAFVAAYRAAFQMLMAYGPNEVGSVVAAERMGALADAYPEWAERAEMAF